jgi:K+-sensing histidine kinase KdpD
MPFVPRPHVDAVGHQTRELDIAIIRADGPLLTRALINLLGNALRHSPSNSTLRVCLASTAREVIFSVHDEGEGMDVETLETLRTGRDRPGPSSTRANDDISAKVKPRGLGMAVVRAVVQRHHGWLEGWSAPGAGTSFFLGLPRHEYAPAQAEELYSASKCLDL